VYKLIKEIPAIQINKNIKSSVFFLVEERSVLL